MAGTATGVPTGFYQVCPRCLTRREWFNVNGGTTYRCAGCEWYWSIQTPAIAAPAVPATTVNATNTTGTIIGVTISGGTLTSVKVNAVQVGTTAGTYLVPISGTINITYTVAPAWTWQLPVTNGAISAAGLAVPLARDGTYFTSGMVLMVDTGVNTEIMIVGAGATGTSIPVTSATPGAGGQAVGFTKAHNSAISFGNLVPVPTLGNQFGQDAVPAAPGWGF